MRTMRFAPALFLAILVSTPAFAETRQLHVFFTANHQSMWGPGSAAPPLTKRFTLIDPNTVKFDYETAGYPGTIGPHTSINTYFWGDLDFGLFARAKAAAKLGLFADLSIPNPGSVDVQYPIAPALTFPDANSFRAGDTVDIKYNLDPTPTGWSMKTTSPKAELEVKGQFGVTLDFFGKLCVIACLDSTGAPLFIPSPLIDVPGNSEFRIFKINTDSSVATPPEFGLVSPISLAAHVPNINLTGTLDSNQKSLVASGNDQFFTATLDVSGVIGDLLHLPPLRFDTNDYGDFDAIAGIRFSYNILGIDASAGLQVKQAFRFDPTPKAVLTFPESMTFAVNSGSQVTGTSVVLSPGDTLHLVTSLRKDAAMPVGPTFRLDNDFRSTTGLALNESVEVSAGAIALKTPEITIIPALCIPGFCIDWGIFGETCVPDLCTPSVTWDPPDFDIGPLYDNTFQLGNQNLGNLIDDHWQMTGFSSEPASFQALSLDPENPIITITEQTGSVRNLGSGKRLVPFVVDIANPGDVLLNKLSLQTSLQNAFANARSFTLDRIDACGLNLNASFDGNLTNELLADGNTLDVSGKKRLTIFAVVSPKPDPDPYTDKSDTSGRSPINTLVNGSASSSVLLGPSKPTGAGDFVIFGEHFVKFDSTGNIFGHVGSNDQVEIKNGASGVVAGDLRAGKYIKVSGSVAGDYAISGGIVDVVGKGALTLFGNKKEFQTITAFVLNSPPWQPATPLAGDIWVPLNTPAVADPGYYGYVTVNTGGSLELRSGTYYINQLLVKNGANVKFDPPVNLIVGTYMEVGAGSTLSGGGSSRDSVINLLQTSDLTTGNGSSIRGTFIAPRSNLMFGASSKLEGSFYGRSITLNSGTTAAYHRDCDPLLDANCDGTPDCP